VKTAVSIPDALFEAADRVARRLGLSRSELYARALERFLDEEPDESVTARLDELYGTEDSALHPGLSAAQRRAISEPW
jgi:metal-responsive CopG/Arc/MetJ family transcriptional regulator